MCRAQIQSESNGEMKCCDSLQSIHETLSKEIEAKIEEQLSKQKKVASSSLTQLNEESCESLEIRIAQLEEQLKSRDEVINSQLKIINEQKDKISTLEEDKTVDYEDDFEDNDY